MRYCSLTAITNCDGISHYKGLAKENGSVVTMSRSLSDLEAGLILHLEWEKQPVVTIEETMAILDCSCDHARQLLHRLARRRQPAPLTPGRYELIPAERGEHAFPDMNALFTGSALVEPYYSALNSHWNTTLLNGEQVR